VLNVLDRGAGIPADEIEHVTKKFFRGRAAPDSGTGLGLAIVARTVAEFGGALSIASTDGEGTVVTVRFPALEGSPSPLVSDEPVLKA
jgi:signal transduction histidine kinase